MTHFLKKENVLKLFKLLNKATQLQSWLTQLGVSLFEKNSRFLKEQMSWEALGNKAQILKAVYLVLPYINYPFLLTSHP